MSIKRNIIAGGAIAVLAASAFTVGQKARRNLQIDWNSEQWLRLLSGSNGASPNPKQPNGKAPNGQVNAPSTPAEFIGRTGYSLYR